MQYPDGEMTQERIEEIFEVPHVHDETIWDALRAIVGGDTPKATVALNSLLQSVDVFVATSELSRTLLCVQALRSAGGTSPLEIFRRMDLRGKRRQDKMIDIAARMTETGRFLPDLATRLLSLDLALKQSKTAAGRREVFLRTFLVLCGEPQLAA